MIAGRTHIRECSLCGKYIKQQTFVSGNTLLARFWTDGKIEGPMLPNEPRLVKCPHCGALIWINEQKYVGLEPEDTSWFDDDTLSIIGEHNSFSNQLKRMLIKRRGSRGSIDLDMDRVKEARSASTPTTDEYFGFLKGSTVSQKEERYVRPRAWWAGNDSRRGRFFSTKLSSFEKDNLRALTLLLNEADDDDRLIKAEALRELAMFADAEHLLSTPFKDKLVKTVGIIRRLNRIRISRVREMRFK